MIKTLSDKIGNTKYSVRRCGFRRWLRFIPYSINDIAKIHLTILPNTDDWSHVRFIITPKTTKQYQIIDGDLESEETNILDLRPIGGFTGCGGDIEIPLTKIERHEIMMQLEKYEGESRHTIQTGRLAYLIPTDSEVYKLAILNAIFSLIIGLVVLLLSHH